MNAALMAGALSGVAGLIVFLVIHHFWIRPIWFILPPGLVLAVLGGLAVGWSYAEIRAGLPARPWTALALAAVIFIILAPSVGLAQLRPPPLDITTGVIPPGQTGRVVLTFVLELALTATVMGGLLGWLLGHTGRASAATALAGLVFALGPGHNIPFLGSTPGVGKGLILLAAIVIVSAIVLVEAHAWLTAGALMREG
jgi:hypothetical protein